MTHLSSDQLQVLVKAYETCQELAKSNAESAWSVRAWGVAVWSAMIAYAFDKNRVEIAAAAGGLLVCVFFIELAIRQIQYAFIERALALEVTFNDVLAGSSPRLPVDGVSTNIDTPRLTGLLVLLRPKRWMIWFPYLLLILGTALVVKIV